MLRILLLIVSLAVSGAAQAQARVGEPVPAFDTRLLEGKALPGAALKGYREKVWDHAAGVLITEEAGGKVTDVHGQPLDFSLGRQLDGNQGIVATNGVLHDRVLAAVREVLGRLQK